ncbi:hypothetical protein [Heyndrickxia acidiproducens]|uniref:hypothetical protein n=1 Tax=Heyndrickxia acidiproducens TaxID=1121084 RepID=UPI00037F8D17|nr:hypothetical protein [Heyndrickxia acidiproducens]
MKKNFNKYTIRNWGRNAKSVCKQLILPFAIFQAIRTIIFPTTFDVLLLAVFIFIYLGFQYEWF